MDDGGCLSVLVGIGVVLYVIYLIIVYVIPVILGAAAIVLGIFGAIGAFIGLGIALYNFFGAVSSVSAKRKIIGRFKNVSAASKYIDDGGFSSSSELTNYIDSYKEARGSNYIEEPDYKYIPTDYGYEDLASKSYFFGPCFNDVVDIIKESFTRNYDSTPDFSKGENWFTKIFFVVLGIFQVMATHVLGTIFTLILSAVLLVLFLCLEIAFIIFSGVALILENIFYLSKKISFRCPNCKHDYKIPVYKCSNPLCNIKHKRLRPGFYGIFKRRCLCGAKIPLVANAKGSYFEKDLTNPSGLTYIKHKFRLIEMSSYCPQCGAEHNAKLSKPTSIALIGGTSSGKTTFKVAFTYTFLEEELTKAGIDYDFPDKYSEEEYNNSVRYFMGRDIIPPTNRGIAFDIATFSFLLKHKKFDISRMIHIYDMPGEVFASGDAGEGWRNYRFTEGMVFLIDSFSLTEIREQHEKDIKAMGICDMQMNELIDSLVNTLQNEKVKKTKGRFKIPVALTINKVDSPILKRMCGGDAVAALMSALPDVFDDYFNTMDYVCRCFLARNGGMGFIASLDNNFESVHFFFSSPMGYIPSSVRTRFAPVNVLPIMQWMMIKADSQLARVWIPDLPVNDVDDTFRSLYREHPEYYEQYVVPLLEEAVHV